MSLFYQIGQWLFGGLTRERGIQYNTPAYSDPSASPVTFDTALQLSAVWACVKLLAETPASLPLHFYRRDGDNLVEEPEHDLARLFRGKVNRYQNRIEFWESVLLNLHTHGNAYIQIIKSGRRITALLPLMSAQMETRLMTDGSVTYQYTQDAGVTIFAESSIWHIKLMGNGITGLSPLAYQRNTLGIAQAAEKAVTNIYANGAKPSGVLKLDRLLTKAQRDEVRESFATLTTGTNNRLMVLEKGTEFQPISLSPQDIELLQSRRFQISEICRWYGVPSVMVNDNNGGTVLGSSVEQIMDGFYKLTLRPTLEKIEESMRVTLLEPAEQQRMEIKFDFDALLRGDKKAMFEAYKTAINGAIITPNEARRLLGYPAMEGADKLLVQGAMVPVEMVSQPPEPPAPPPPAPDVTPQIDALADEVRSLRELTILHKSQPVAAPQTNISLDVKTDKIETAIQGAIDRMGDAHKKSMQEVKQEMPINISVQPTPVQVTVEAPIVNVESPNVTVEATVPAAEVIVAHPSRAIQTVERDKDDEIVRTITTYEK